MEIVPLECERKRGPATGTFNPLAAIFSFSHHKYQLLLRHKAVKEKNWTDQFDIFMDRKVLKICIYIPANFFYF